MKILIVEDDPEISSMVREGLDEAGYFTTVCRDGERAMRLATGGSFSLILLDIMIPSMDGIQVCASLRKAGVNTPILMLTARDAVNDRVTGLESGADDYLVKPFSFSELLARVRALLRRGSFEQQAVLRVEGLELDLLKRVASRNGMRLDLSNRQFELLSYLMQNADSVLTREMIARDVWKESTATWTNVIEVHIAQLRRKIERADWLPILHTVRGQGYLLGKMP